MNVEINGAPIYFELFGCIPITATLVVSWVIMIILTGLCIWLTRDLKVQNVSKRQAVAEYRGADVEWYIKADDIVLRNKGGQSAGNPQNHAPQGQQKNK